LKPHRGLGEDTARGDLLEFCRSNKMKNSRAKPAIVPRNHWHNAGDARITPIFRREAMAATSSCASGKSL
jgi:hypothetical protein